MKRIVILLLAILLLFSACGSKPSVSPPAPPETPAPSEPVSPAPAPETPAGPIALPALTVEVVVSWEDADPILGELGTLSALLAESLSLQGYETEGITVTVNTAGGFTGDALSSGGVDIALLPTVDYVSCEEDTFAVLMTEDEPCTGVVAVSCLREDLDEAFRAALAAALLDTEPGQEFLEICSPDFSYEPATAEALQAVKDWMAKHVHPEHGGN